MSSGYATTRIDRERAEQLRRQREQALKAAKEQLRKDLLANLDSAKAMTKEGAPSSVGLTTVTLLQQTVLVEDEISGGTKLRLMVDAGQIDVPEQTDADKTRAEIARREREELDFSSLLYGADGRRPSRAEMELNALLQKVDDRPVLTEKDADARKRLRAEISAVMSNDSYDAREKADILKMRIDSYLLGGRTLTRDDELRIEDDYLEYCALCAMVGMKPVETLPYRVANEIQRLTSVLEKRKENEYIMEVLESVMEELGCHVKEEAVMGGAVGQLFSVDGTPICDVFMAVENSGIMFEPVAEVRPSTLDKKRQVESSVERICTLYDEIERRAAEKGVILTRVYRDPANADAMCVQSDITEHRGRKERKKGTVKALEAE